MKARQVLKEQKCWVKKPFWCKEKELRSRDTRVARRNERNLTEEKKWDTGGNELTVGRL